MNLSGGCTHQNFGPYNSIFFSEPYHQARTNINSQNIELNQQLAKDIYKKSQNSIAYSDFNTYNRNYNNSNTGLLTNKSSRLNSNYNIRQGAISHNILKTSEKNIQIQHHIPSLNSEEILKHKRFQKKLNKTNKMYNPRYNEYPPMNGFTYNHMLGNNPGGYSTNTNNRDVANLTLQQHNMHGGNDLLFKDGNVPNGFYDQSNFAGTNSLVCGPGGNMSNAGMNMKPSYGIMPYYNPVAPTNYPLYSPGYSVGRTNTGYNHECNYIPAMPVATPVANNTIEKEIKKEISRKNISKVKKGVIDINIETSSSSRQGISIDLNVGV